MLDTARARTRVSPGALPYLSNIELEEDTRVFTFGRYFGNCSSEEDWTFRNLAKPGDEHRESSLTRHLPTIAETLGIGKLLVPSPEQFNARVLSSEEAADELTKRIALPGVDVLRGTYADGCELAPGDAYAVSTGGCAVIIGRRLDENGMPEKVATAHAGLRSLVRYPEEGWPAFTSVVSSLFQALKLGNGSTERFRGTIVLPIDSESFRYPLDHLEFGAVNRQRREHLLEQYGEAAVPGEPNDGRIDITAIIVKQFELLGVEASQLSCQATTATYGHLAYTTRNDDKNRRNLVIVARYA